MSSYAHLMESYDEAYQKCPELFGETAEEILLRLVTRFPRGTTILDIGCGTGRNSLEAAGQGHRVTAIDPSAQALEILQARAKASGLEIETKQSSFEDFQPQNQGFDVICIFGLLQMLEPAEILTLLERIESWSGTGTFLLIVAWSTSDPQFEKISRSGVALPDAGLPLRSFRTAEGANRSYFLPGRLPGIFPDWERLFIEEKLGPWHQHGESAPERHAVIEFVGKRQ